MTKGSEGPSMAKTMALVDAPMFKGGPDDLQSGKVLVNAVALADDSNNYHFFPHVAWIEPGTTVRWEHYVKPDVSVAIPHTTTALSGEHFGVRLIPEDADGWDSGYMAGLGSMMSVKEDFFDSRENYGITNNYGKQVVGSTSKQIRGGFEHTFQTEGVYLYYCQNHYKFKMAGAVVVGHHGGGTEGDGWSPAMTADVGPIEDDVGGAALVDQIGELRDFVEKGGGMGGM